MTTKTPTADDLKQAMRERGAQLEHDNVTAIAAQRLVRRVEDMRRELAQHEHRRSRFAALGDKHLEIPNSPYLQGLGVITRQPARSLLPGTELARREQEKCDHILGEIAAYEAQFAELISPDWSMVVRD